MAVRARVIVLAGPSGSGKSRLAARLGLPVLRLDDFYRDGDDPSLPRIEHGANAGMVDWDHPGSWLPDDALATMVELCREGRADVPVYEIAANGRTGHRVLDLGGSALFIAEGIFAPDVVAPARGRHPGRRLLRAPFRRHDVRAAARARPAGAPQAAAGAGAPRPGAGAGARSGRP